MGGKSALNKANGSVKAKTESSRAKAMNGRRIINHVGNPDRVAVSTLVWLFMEILPAYPSTTSKKAIQPSSANSD